MGQLRDRVVVITGAGGSIAGAVADALRAVHARPALIDRNLLRIRGRAKAFATAAVQSSLESSQEAQRAIDAVLQHHRRLDGLVHLVGDRHAGSVSAIDDASFDAVFDSYVRTLHLCVRAVLPHLLKQRRGFIAGVASKGAWLGGMAGGADGAAVFAAAKSAVGAYLHALDDELRGSGVRVGVVYPMGVVNTELNRRALGRGHSLDLVEPEAIAHALVCAADIEGGGRFLDIPVHPTP